MLTVVASVLTAIVVSVVTSIITYFLTRRREHEADWRKLKLEQYREFVRALSGNVVNRSTAEAQERYADAVNTMTLVAPPAVLRALQSFQAYNSPSNRSKSRAEHDRALSILLRAMRIDVHPACPQDPEDFVFILWDAGPAPAEDIEHLRSI